MSPVDHSSHQESPIFTVNALSFSYPDGTAALHDLRLTIAPGERIALMGRNGSGKSTLLRLLNGLLPLQDGEILYRQQPLPRQTRLAPLPTAGILFQDPDDHLFCNSLFEDVAFGLLNQGLPQEEAAVMVEKWLTAVDLADLMYKPAHHLSYGQKKRAALAALLARQPEILLLDEPSANLDSRQEAALARLLASYQGTLLVIDHNLLFLYTLCQRGIVLANGQIVHDTSMRDLAHHSHSLREHGLDFTFRFCCCGHDHPPLAEEPHRHHFLQHHHSAADSHQREDNPAIPLIELQHFHYAYPDGTAALANINLTIHHGERLALIGENGAGKSTLAGCLLGLHPGEGRYFLKGAELAPGQRGLLWRQLGMVFQNAADQLFCPSCAEEVAFGPRQMRLPAEEIHQRVQGALAAVHLSGYDQRVPLHMSGGERKRLAIAAALSMRPQLLILDEPTAGLDPHSQELLLAILRQLSIATLLITHDLFFIEQLSSRAIVLHGGLVVRDYPTVDFLADDQLQELNGLDYSYQRQCLTELLEQQQAPHSSQ